MTAKISVRRLAVTAVALLVVVVAVLLVVQQLREPKREVLTADSVVIPRAVSHNASGVVATPSVFAGLNVTLKSTGLMGTEPTIGVTSNGAIFITGGDAQVWRSTNQGARWTDVSDRGPTTRTDEDPYLWVDPRTDRIFSAPNQGMCSDVRWSDDGGENWHPQLPELPLVGRPPPPPQQGGCGNRGHDHQSLVAGPPAGNQTTRDYNNTVYYAYSDAASTTATSAAGGTWLSRSFDGGRTWTNSSTQVFPSDCQLGLNGVPAISPNGTIYIPKPGCNGLRIAVSWNGGERWNISDLNDRGMSGGNVTTGVVQTYSTNPAVAVDLAGNAYALWAGDDGLLYLSSSVDGGISWSVPVRATPPGVNITAFGGLVAGGAGHVALAYLATPANATNWQHKEAHFAPAGTPWYLHMAWSLNALALDPLFTTLNATAENDTVHLGQIWQGGNAPSQTGRQLGDFLGMTQHAGRIYVAYADSCNKCTTPPNGDGALWLARSEGAPPLTTKSPLQMGSDHSLRTRR